MPQETVVKIKSNSAILEGGLAMPKNPIGIVIFAHGSGSSRFSPRNRYVAKVLNKAGIATLLIDLLSKEEEAVDEATGELRFNIPFLAERLLFATKWIRNNATTKNMELGYFGASTGAAAALVAASKRDDIKAIVSRGGRPDLAKGALAKVKAPTLLIVGGNDDVVINLNQEAMKQLKAEKKLEIIPGASHLFEESGKLEKAAELATRWFVGYFSKTVLR